MTVHWTRSFPQKELVMLKTELHNRDTGGEPAARFATDAEIEIADRLRHQLEERYLARTAPSAPASPSQKRSSEGH
jgi:hypothetical protein